MEGFSSNKAISLAEGRILVAGEERTNLVKCNAKFTLRTAEVPVIGSRSTGDKTLGYKITGALTEYKATKWLVEYCKNFQDTGIIEPFDIQGVIEDKNSTFYSDNGTGRNTLVNCVLTGDVPIFDIDITGETVQDEITFTAEKII